MSRVGTSNGMNERNENDEVASDHDDTVDYVPRAPSVASADSRTRTPIPVKQTSNAMFKRTPSRASMSRDIESPDSGTSVLITEAPCIDGDGRQFHPAFSNDGAENGSRTNSPDFILHDTGYDTDLEIEDDESAFGDGDEFDPSGSQDYIKECNRLGVIPTSYFLRHIQDREFIMRNHGLGPNGAKAIAKPFEVNTMIEKIDIEGNCIESQGARHLSRMLRENLYVTDLRLAQNGIGGEGAQCVCDMLLDNKIIQILDLSGNNLKDHDGEMFYKILEKNAILQKLYLSNNGFEYNAASWFREGLALNESLKVLDLSWNHIRLQGARSLAEGIQENYGLKEFYVSMNGFGYDGAKRMGDALKQNQSLEVLDLSNNRIPDEGILEIAKALRVNEHLSVIRLGYNPISPPGATPIMMAIQRNEGTAVKCVTLRGVMVLEEFDTLQQEMAKTKVITVVHAGIILDGGEMKLPPPNRIDPERLFWSDPMTKLKQYAIQMGFRLLDVFQEFDRDRSWTVNREEFINGVKAKSIPMTEDEIDILISRLDSDGDGEIDYKELVSGEEENRALQFNMLKYQADKKAAEIRTPSPDILGDVIRK